MIQTGFYKCVKPLFFHRKRNSLFIPVNAYYLNLNHVTDFEHLRGVLYLPVGNLGHVHKSVLMHTDVDKSAEVNHISHRSV